MKMKMKLLLFAALIMSSIVTNAQFEGSYVMKVESVETKPVETRYVVKGDMASMQMLNADVKGYMKTIINRKDKTITSLIENSGNKMALRTALPDFKSSASSTERPKLIETGKTKEIDGYTCKQIISESKDNTAEMWITTDLGLSMADVLRMAAGGSTRNLEQFYIEKGVSLQTTVKDKKNSKTTVMLLKDIKRSDIPASEFSMEGYKLMEAPAMGK